MTIGQQVREQRQRRSHSLAAVAREVDRSESFLSLVERDARRCSPELEADILRALDRLDDRISRRKLEEALTGVQRAADRAQEAFGNFRRAN